MQVKRKYAMENLAVSVDVCNYSLLTRQSAINYGTIQDCLELTVYGRFYKDFYYYDYYNKIF